MRSWIEQWQISLDDIDLELPEVLAEIDPRSRLASSKTLPQDPWS